MSFDEVISGPAVSSIGQVQLLLLTRPFMNRTLKAIQRGVKAALAGPAPQSFKAVGKTIACSHCGGEGFVPHDLDRFASQGLLREHYGLECSACGHLELFTKKPIETETLV
jgi:hypothetical protein